RTGQGGGGGPPGSPVGRFEHYSWCWLVWPFVACGLVAAAADCASVVGCFLASVGPWGDVVGFGAVGASPGVVVEAYPAGLALVVVAGGDAGAVGDALRLCPV